MNAPTSFTPPSASPSVNAGAAPAPATSPLVAGAGAADPLAPLSGQPHPLFTSAWADALALRLAHVAHGHTAASDDAIGPCLIAERAQARLIMALDSLRGEPSTLPQRLCGRTRTVTLRRLANSMALIAAAHDAITRLPEA